MKYEVGLPGREFWVSFSPTWLEMNPKSEASCLLFILYIIKLSELGLCITHSSELMKPSGCYDVVIISITDQESTVCAEAS